MQHVLVALHASQDEAGDAEGRQTDDRLARGGGVDRLPQGEGDDEETPDPAGYQQAAELEEEHRPEQQGKDEQGPQVEQAAGEQHGRDEREG